MKYNHSDQVEIAGEMKIPRIYREKQCPDCEYFQKFQKKTVVELSVGLSSLQKTCCNHAYNSAVFGEDVVVVGECVQYCENKIPLYEKNIKGRSRRCFHFKNVNPQRQKEELFFSVANCGPVIRKYLLDCCGVKSVSDIVSKEESVRKALYRKPSFGKPRTEKLLESAKSLIL